MGSFSGWLSHFNPDANLVLATLMAPYAAATLRQTGPFSPRIDRHLSNITYDVYLLHWSAATALLRFDGDVSAYQRLPLIALAWVIVPLSRQRSISGSIGRSTGSGRASSPAAWPACP